MTAFDFTVLGILFFSPALGFWRGLVGEIISLLAWVAAILAAWIFGPEAAKALTAIADPGIRLAAGYAAVFFSVLVLLALLRQLIRGTLKMLGISFIDRFLGLVFGLARGLLIVLLLVAIGGLTPAPKEQWWRAAALAPPLETAVLALRPWLPHFVAERISFR